jgi:hypothetical protein
MSTERKARGGDDAKQLLQHPKQRRRTRIERERHILRRRRRFVSPEEW